MRLIVPTTTAIFILSTSSLVAQNLSYGVMSCSEAIPNMQINDKESVGTLNWIFGYLTAAATYEKLVLENAQFASGLPNDFIEPVITAFITHCTNNPLHTVQQAGNALVDQLGGNLGN